MPHLISILVCARNEKDYLGHTLDSLRCQDIDTELVVVDNASTDQTNEIALRYTNCVYRCDLKGKVPCLQVGIKHVSSNVVAMADADTVYPANWASTILQAFHENSSAQIVFGPSTLGFETTIGRRWGARLSSCFVIPSLWLSVICSLGFNMALRKEALEKILATFPPVAYSGWGIGTQTLRTFGRKSICYVSELQVPKCMRRYDQQGMTRTTARWLKEMVQACIGEAALCTRIGLLRPMISGDNVYGR